MGELLSIQGEAFDLKSIPIEFLKCLAGRRHDLDGHVYVEHHMGRTVWAERLECTRCGTHRLGFFKPNSSERIGTYQYSDRPSNYDGSIQPSDAHKELMKRRLVKTKAKKAK